MNWKLFIHRHQRGWNRHYLCLLNLGYLHLMHLAEQSEHSDVIDRQDTVIAYWHHLTMMLYFHFESISSILCRLQLILPSFSALFLSWTSIHYVYSSSSYHVFSAFFWVNKVYSMTSMSTVAHLNVIFCLLETNKCTLHLQQPILLSYHHSLPSWVNQVYSLSTAAHHTVILLSRSSVQYTFRAAHRSIIYYYLLLDLYTTHMC